MHHSVYGLPGDLQLPTDGRFRYHYRNKSFLTGFGQTAFTGDEIKRIRWYDIILYLTMMIEVYYREYETENRYFRAKDKLMTVWLKAAV